jgi:hypothetical protein
MTTRTRLKFTPYEIAHVAAVLLLQPEALVSRLTFSGACKRAYKLLAIAQLAADEQELYEKADEVLGTKLVGTTCAVTNDKD